MGLFDSIGNFFSDTVGSIFGSVGDLFGGLTDVLGGLDALTSLFSGGFLNAIIGAALSSTPLGFIANLASQSSFLKSVVPLIGNLDHGIAGSLVSGMLDELAKNPLVEVLTKVDGIGDLVDEFGAVGDFLANAGEKIQDLSASVDIPVLGSVKISADGVDFKPGNDAVAVITGDAGLMEVIESKAKDSLEDLLKA